MVSWTKGTSWLLYSLLATWQLEILATALKLARSLCVKNRNLREWYEAKDFLDWSKANELDLLRVALTSFFSERRSRKRSCPAPH